MTNRSGILDVSKTAYESPGDGANIPGHDVKESYSMTHPHSTTWSSWGEPKIVPLSTSMRCPFCNVYGPHADHPLDRVGFLRVCRECGTLFYERDTLMIFMQQQFGFN